MRTGALAYIPPDSMIGKYSTNLSTPLTWDTKNITNMKEMFCGAFSFNQSINTFGANNWDVSNVVDMKGMFLHQYLLLF